MIPVVFSSDHNFVMPTGVAMLSMLQAAPGVVFDIFILQGEDLNDNDREMLTGIASRGNSKITFITPGGQFSGSYEVRGISTACYYRLLIPWLIPQYDKVIYLDGDIIVKKDISKMLRLADDPRMLVYGVRTGGFVSDPDLVGHIQSLGLDNRHYINSGIQVFNSKAMRDNSVLEQFLKYKDARLLYQDQDIINIVCRDKIGWLPLEFNSSPSLPEADRAILIDNGIATDETIDRALTSPAIIHYAGKKPWKTFTFHWWDWWHVYSSSPFYDYRFAHRMSAEIIHPTYSISRLLKMLAKKILKKD